jgi:hypothetical protein
MSIVVGQLRACIQGTNDDVVINHGKYVIYTCAAGI